MHTVFEVGKKYLTRANKVVTCLYVDDDHVLMKHDLNGYKYLVYRSDIEEGDFPKYMEPIKKVYSIFVAEAPGNAEPTFFIKHFGCRGLGDEKFVSSIELTYDIHNGLKVEVIPGIG